MTDLEPLRRHFRDALAADPPGAYRDWFRAQEELRSERRDDASRALADDLWELIPALAFPGAEARARFLHNAAVFYGSPGPAADLERARRLFADALGHGTEDGDGGWHARALHNLATALSNLGESETELDPERCAEHLADGAAALEEAIAIRERQGLADGLAHSRRQLEITRARLSAVTEPPR